MENERVADELSKVTETVAELAAENERLKTVAMGPLYAAMAKAQASIQAASKDGNNPHFRSRFASLKSVVDVIREPFAAAGLCWWQDVSVDGVSVSCVTNIAHESGAVLRSSPYVVKAKDSMPQSIGSATTYARRYSLSPFTTVVPDDDDDGEAAHGRQQSAPPPAKSAPKQGAKPPKEQGAKPEADEASTPMTRQWYDRMGAAVDTAGLDSEAAERLAQHAVGKALPAQPSDWTMADARKFAAALKEIDHAQ